MREQPEASGRVQTKLSHERKERGAEERREELKTKRPGVSQESREPVAEMAGLFREEKLGEAKARAWAGEVKGGGGVRRLGGATGTE